MNEHTDIERVLEHWFDEGPSTMPDRVVTVVADRIDRQRQRRPWRLPWRPSTMHPTLKLGAGLAAVLLIALVGYQFLPRTGGVGIPAATPSPSLAPTPTGTPTATPSAPASPSAAAIECANGTTGCLGPLAEGDYQATRFMVPFAYHATDDAWQNVMDTPASFILVSQSGRTIPIQVFGEIGLIDEPDACGPAPAVHPATSVQDVIDYLGAHPALEAKPPAAVELDGYAGLIVDFKMASTWTHVCADADPNNPSVVLLGDASPEPARLVAYGADQEIRWTVLDVAGETIVIEQAVPLIQATFEQAMVVDRPVIDSIDFAPAS